MAQNESLLYVVDFEENMGSAVLAADDRIYTPILAVTESGSLLTSVDKIPYIQGENYDEADLTNFSLYNANEDDYYVGIADNFALEVCEKYATSQVLQTSDETSYSNSSSNTTYTGPDFGNWIITEKYLQNLQLRGIKVVLLMTPLLLKKVNIHLLDVLLLLLHRLLLITNILII